MPLTYEQVYGPLWIQWLNALGDRPLIHGDYIATPLDFVQLFKDLGYQIKVVPLSEAGHLNIKHHVVWLNRDLSVAQRQKRLSELLGTLVYQKTLKPGTNFKLELKGMNQHGQ